MFRNRTFCRRGQFGNYDCNNFAPLRAGERFTVTPLSGLSTGCGERFLFAMQNTTTVSRFLSRIGKPTHFGRWLCWPWIGGIDKQGYGRLSAPRTPRSKLWTPLLAHRYSYEYFIGPIPFGLVLDHKCRNRCCVNPKHLDPVTNGVNTLRGNGPAAMNARKTHCKRGHSLSGSNVRIATFKNGKKSRICRKCMAWHMRNFRATKPKPTKEQISNLRRLAAFARWPKTRNK